MNRSLCSYNLSPIGSTSEESSNSDESDDEQESDSLGRKFTKTVGILRQSPRKNKIISHDKSNKANPDAFSQSCDKDLKENRDDNNDKRSEQEQVGGKFGGTIKGMNEEETAKEGEEKPKHRTLKF